MRPYTRSLDPQDYEFLPHAAAIREFERKMTAMHHISHEHKLWENASIMQQLEELNVPKNARIIDVASGGLYFPPYLVTVGGYRDLVLTDHDPNVGPMIDDQNRAYGLSMSFLLMKAEDMAALPSEQWDVVMCISSIEHVVAENHDCALRELWRLTKPGGLIFITSDYFRADADGNVDAAQYAASPFRHCQETAYHEALIKRIPDKIAASFIGETDLTYRGDFVHNYSFCNICLRKNG